MVRTRLKDPAPAAHAALPPGTVDRLRAGDAGAFAVVYQAYRTRLYSFLLRLTHDEALAADLMQETWLRLAASARALAPDSQPLAWLLRVARNLFISQRRWAVLHQAALAALQLSNTPARLPSALEQIAADATQLRLERALAALPLRYREVLLLIVVEGLAPAEVANMLDITPETVRKRLSRGRAALQRAMEET